ncbi:MAG: NADPH:quinone reductase [Alphaproteobacteria bacterium]|nr:NADPH:quinone reductase [Alphaproteobacteria bacterium]
MRAVWYAKNGPAAEVLTAGEIDRPKPGEGEVLIRVHASGVNPIDVKWRKGLRPVPAGDRLVPHFDGAGVIEAVGAGVDPSRVGERVWIFEANWQRTAGTAAEYTVLPSTLAVPLPKNADFVAGATLGIPALTAHGCLFQDGPIDGAWVLVTGGAGAVGHFAVQLAKIGGARVIATASGPKKAEAARLAGADHVIDYKQEDVAARVKAIAGGVDRICEVALAANFAVSAEIMNSGGVLATYASDADPDPKLPFRKFLYKNVVLRHVLVFGLAAAAKTLAIADITTGLSSGRLKPFIGSRFPLAQAAKAHETVEAGALGKVVIEI